jgi:hypothetical protein
MMLPLEFDVVDCRDDERALNAGGTAAEASAKPAHSKRFRRVRGAGSNILELPDLDFMRLAFCVMELFGAPGKFQVEH